MCGQWEHFKMLLLVQLHVWHSFSQTFFLTVPCISPHKVTYWDFEILKIKKKKKKRLKFLLTWTPWEWNFKTLLLQLWFFSNQLFRTLAVTILSKVTYRNFEISYLILKKDWNLPLSPMGKWNINNIVEMASRRAKGSEIWESGILVLSIYMGVDFTF